MEEGKRQSLVKVISLLRFGLLNYIIWQVLVVAAFAIGAGVVFGAVFDSAVVGLVVGGVVGGACVAFLAVLNKLFNWLFGKL